MTFRMSRLAGTMLATALALGTVVAFPASTAAREEQKERDCVGPARWRLEVQNEDGGLQVDLRIRDARAGSTWHITMRHEGNRFVNVTRRADEDGEIRLRRQRRNTRGTDTFRFRAAGPGDQVCRGVLVF
jgi:hypothetical protein